MHAFSLRTLMFLTTAVATVCGIFLSTGLPPTIAHLLLVLSFAVPGGSYAYDRAKTADAAARGTLIAAIAGTILASLIVLAFDVWSIWAA